MARIPELNFRVSVLLVLANSGRLITFCGGFCLQIISDFGNVSNNVVVYFDDPVTPSVFSPVVINDRLVYTSQLENPVFGLGPDIYFYYSTVNERWEAVTDLNDPVNTLYSYLEVDTEIPIGNWICARPNGEDCYKDSYGLLVTTADCSDPYPTCLCRRIALEDNNVPASGTYTYTTCNFSTITETLSLPYTDGTSNYYTKTLCIDPLGFQGILPSGMKVQNIQVCAGGTNVIGNIQSNKKNKSSKQRHYQNSSGQRSANQTKCPK